MAEIKVSKKEGTNFIEVVINKSLNVISMESACELLDKLDSCIHDRHVHNTTFQFCKRPGAHDQQIPQSGLHRPGAHDQQIPQPLPVEHQAALRKSFEKMCKRSDFFSDMARVLGDRDGQIIAQEILDIIKLETKD